MHAMYVPQTKIRLATFWIQGASADLNSCTECLTKWIMTTESILGLWALLVCTLISWWLKASYLIILVIGRPGIPLPVYWHNSLYERSPDLFPLQLRSVTCTTTYCRPIKRSTGQAEGLEAQDNSQLRCNTLSKTSYFMSDLVRLKWQLVHMSGDGEGELRWLLPRGKPGELTTRAHSSQPEWRGGRRRRGRGGGVVRESGSGVEAEMEGREREKVILMRMKMSWSVAYFINELLQKF